MTELVLLIALGNLATAPVIFWLGANAAAAHQGAEIALDLIHAFARPGGTDTDKPGPERS